MHDTVITPAGLSQLQDELDRLRTLGRREIAERIGDAVASSPNLAENGVYHAALDDQALLERRIARLEHRIGTAIPVEPDASNGVVDVGERVHLHDLDTGAKVEYDLVGSFESDPSAGRISAASPLGQALLGRQQGDVAVVDAPRGELRYEILAIELPPPATNGSAAGIRAEPAFATP
jgi:transcription elongation factor GreA